MHGAAQPGVGVVAGLERGGGPAERGHRVKAAGVAEQRVERHPGGEADRERPCLAGGSGGSSPRAMPSRGGLGGSSPRASRATRASGHCARGLGPSAERGWDGGPMRRGGCRAQAGPHERNVCRAARADDDDDRGREARAERDLDPRRAVGPVRPGPAGLAGSAGRSGPGPVPAVQGARAGRVLRGAGGQGVHPGVVAGRVRLGRVAAGLPPGPQPGPGRRDRQRVAGARPAARRWAWRTG